MAALLSIHTAWPLKTFCQSASSLVPQQSFTLQEYIAELDHCSAVLNASPGNSAAINDLRMTLPANWTVTAGEARYSVSTAWLTGPLSRIEKNPSANSKALAQIRQELRTYIEAAQTLETPTLPQNLAQSRARLNAILSATEFRGQAGPSWLDLLKARAWSWIVRQLERVFGRLGRSRTIGNIVAWTVIALACLLLLFWTVRFLMRAGSRSEMDLSGATPVNRDWHRRPRRLGRAGGAARRAGRRCARRLPRCNSRRVLGSHRADGRDAITSGGSLANSSRILTADQKGKRGLCAAPATDTAF